MGLSDHFLTFCTRKTVRGSINKHKTTKIRSLKNYTKDDFLHRLKNGNLVFMLQMLKMLGLLLVIFLCQF